MHVRSNWSKLNMEQSKPLGGKPKIPKRKVKAQKQGHLTIGGAFLCRNMIG